MVAALFLLTACGPQEVHLELVGDSREWANPSLIIRPDGVEVRATSLPAPRLVMPNEPPELLASLPESDWPHGRVVAGSEVGIRSGSDSEKIRAHRNAVEDALQRIGVRIQWWPSA